VDLESLNGRFGMPGRVEFVAGPGGMPHARLRAGRHGSEVALQGGHVVRYGAEGEPPILWASRQALYAPGKAIRGGVPVCWPWFGPHPADPAKPAHGFARTRLWEVTGGGESADGVWLRLGLRSDEATLALWPHPFALELTVTVGPRLQLTLATHNPGARPFSFGGALHSYFTVADVTRASVEGLDGARYIDQLTGEELRQEGLVTIAGELDRVYFDPGPSCAIRDPLLGRRITVTKTGSGTTVVWNPWREKAARLADFADDEYPGMLCVETALALGDSVTLAPGASHTLRATLAAEPL
jgi:glucose-6-phosphate 1-epimerase